MRKMVQRMSGSERVFTVGYYWDGPRTGGAELKGEPHAYECVLDDPLDEWSWFYLLKSIDPGALQLVMESWQIWLRREDAFHSGQTTSDTGRHYLPIGLGIWNWREHLDSKLEALASSDLAANGEFERSGPPGTSGPWEVVWTTIDRASLGHVARVGSSLRSPDIDTLGGFCTTCALTAAKFEHGVPIRIKANQRRAQASGRGRGGIGHEEPGRRKVHHVLPRGRVSRRILEGEQ